MTARELETAIVGPAALVGMGVEPALLAQLLVRTDDHHGSLPLLQYALSVQFDAADDGVLTLETHDRLGGLHAILARHADAQYNALSEHDQHLAQRVLLRMVRVGPAGAARRRAPIAELTDLSAATEALSVVLDSLDEHRLVTFDRDALSGEATVELAHDTLLSGWPRLASWIEHHRDALVRLESLRLALAGWERADRHPDHLLTGNRLAVIDQGPLHEAVALNDAERSFLDRSRSHQRAIEAGETARAHAERRILRRSRRRLVALAVAIVLLVGLGAWALVLVRDTSAERVVLLRPELGDVAAMVEDGFDRAVGQFGYTSNRVVLPGSPDAVDDALSADPGLVVAFAGGEDLQTIADAHSRTRFVVLDGVVAAPNVASVIFDANEASFLAGAAAALTSRTGTIGFIGGVDEDVIHAFEAGFTAGARHVDPDIRVLTNYLTQPPNYDGYLNPALGRRAALDLFQHGADVVFAAAGLSGLGAIDAAVEVSTDTGTQRWAIGVDSDQYVTIEKRPEIADPAAWQAHILTSVTKGLDEVTYDALADPTGTAFQPGVHHLGLEDGAVDISYTGGHIDAIRPQLEELRAAIIAGSIAVPTTLT
jgi:basic membrane protein A